MAINMNALGKETAWTESVVTQSQITELCHALEDYNPLFLEKTVAEANGLPDTIAPPTFINLFRNEKTTLVLSEAEVDLPMLFHGEQVIHYYAPIHPGMRVWHRIKIIDVGRKKSKTYGEISTFTVKITVKNGEDEKLVEATQLFFVRD